MTLRAKIILYFVALHVVLGAAAAFVLIERPMLLFIVEILFVVSIVISYRLVLALFVPLDILRTGAELINEREFTSRFNEIGQPEMDALIRVYNAMIDRLRDERLAAEEQHQLLQKIVQASPSGIAICDFDGNVQQMNPAARKLVDGALLTEMRAIRAGESRLISRQGPQRLKVWRIEFVDRGFPKTFFVIEEMTEELRLSEKAAYEKLIRMMSHEVNNSVGAVRSLLESILRYARDVRDTDREDYTTAVTVASSRIDALNRFMRDFAEVVQIPPPHRTRVDLAALVRDIHSLLRPETDSRQIEVRLDLRRAAAVEADRAQLEQVVLNVMRNAIESIGTRGTITVTLDDGALTIADSGGGVPESDRAEIFQPFFSTKRDGRGLGLTVVQEILSNHAFPFALENGAEGGAVFRIGLPR